MYLGECGIIASERSERHTIRGIQIGAGAVYMDGGGCGTIGVREKRARHYQGCTDSSWCGKYIYIYLLRTTPRYSVEINVFEQR